MANARCSQHASDGQQRGDSRTIIGNSGTVKPRSLLANIQRRSRRKDSINMRADRNIVLSSSWTNAEDIPRAPVPQMAAPQCVPSPIATPRTALPASEARQTRGEFRAVLQAGRSPAAMRVAPPTLPHAERGSWTLAILQRDTNRIVVSEGSQPYGLLL